MARRRNHRGPRCERKLRRTPGVGPGRHARSVACTQAVYYRDRRGAEPVDEFIQALPPRRAAGPCNLPRMHMRVGSVGRQLGRAHCAPAAKSRTPATSGMCGRLGVGSRGRAVGYPEARHRPDVVSEWTCGAPAIEPISQGRGRRLEAQGYAALCLPARSGGPLGRCCCLGWGIQLVLARMTCSAGDRCRPVPCPPTAHQHRATLDRRPALRRQAVACAPA